MLQVQIYLEDIQKQDRKGELLSVVKVKPIEGIPDREVVNNAIKPIQTWLMGIHNSNLVVAIGKEKK
jgi:hypothetical protein